MATGDHKYVKLKEQDTVILSSTPIPESGNDALIGNMVDDLMRKGVHVYRHQTHDVDGCGPLHVSGHCSLDEYMDMIEFTRPKFLLPIYGAFRAQKYHNEEAIKRGFPRKNLSYISNGEVFAFTPDSMEKVGEIPHGTVLVDQTGAMVSNIVVKDRLILAEEGLVAVVLTLDRRTGALLTSPDILSRGFIYMRDNEELMNEFRVELRRAVQQRFKRVDLDRFKQELKDHVTHFLYEKTQRSPIVIPVVNVIAGNSKGGGEKPNGQPAANKEPAKPDAAALQKRYAEMRQQLLNQDPRTD
jgi:ribonuclease J